MLAQQLLRQLRQVPLCSLERQLWAQRTRQLQALLQREFWGQLQQLLLLVSRQQSRHRQKLRPRQEATAVQEQLQRASKLQSSPCSKQPRAARSKQGRQLQQQGSKNTCSKNRHRLCMSRRQGRAAGCGQRLEGFHGKLRQQQQGSRLQAQASRQ